MKLLLICLFISTIITIKEKIDNQNFDEVIGKLFKSGSMVNKI
jgi:hypothetical protein